MQKQKKVNYQKIIAGVDPGKENPQAAVFNRTSVHQKIFAFQVRSKRYREILQNPDSIIPISPYRVCKLTGRSLPEIHIKYLKRRLHKPCSRKSPIACVPVLLKLMMSLVKSNSAHDCCQSETNADFQSAE